MRLIRFLLLLSLLTVTTQLSAKALTVDQVPDPLKPWIYWSLQGDDTLSCPYNYNEASRGCAWPTTLQLKLHDKGGTFSQQWQTFAPETAVALPGDGEHWPQNVRDENGTLIIQSIDDQPYVHLGIGTHTLSGEFHWNQLPKSLKVTPEAGLIELSVNDAAVANPKFSDGELWLTQSSSEGLSEDNLDVQVFRKIFDGHPIEVTTTLKLRVSGKQRNMSLGPVLLDGFMPLSIDSPLPARMDGKQQLQIQLRPGEWSISVTGRSLSDLTEFKLPASTNPWPSEEVWVFAADSNMRQVQVGGVNSIDPNQTSLPEEWKALPAYLMNTDSSMSLEVLQRGATQVGHNDLHLARQMWLDYDGGGYTLKDNLSGMAQQESRLNVIPTLELGRVSVDGKPQFITREGSEGNTGVEIRNANINLEAESRYIGTRATPPVSGWLHDLKQVNTTLHLPPGWRLFSVSGTDNVPDTWIQSWSLLDLFLVLVIALAVGYLYSWTWGGFALLALVLTWQEMDAPRFIWLNLLAVIALLRVLPESWFKTLLQYYRWVSLLALALIVLPYMLHTIRIGLYPQLESEYYSSSNWDTSLVVGMASAPVPEPAAVEVEAVGDNATANMAAQQEMNANDMVQERMAKVMPRPVMPPQIIVSEISGKGNYSMKSMRKQVDLQAIDPNSIVQTGFGLPAWQGYRTVELNWSGPVKADETSSITYISPNMNLFLKLLGILFILGLAWRMLSANNRFDWQPPKDWQDPKQWTTWLKRNTPAALLLIMAGFGFGMMPQTARAEVIPDPQTIQQLHDRLTAAPDCLPSCAQIEQMLVLIADNQLQLRLKVHAMIDTALPLPGSQDTWLAQTVLLDNEPATALKRDNSQQLWLVVKQGQHEVVLSGLLPQRNSVPLPLPLKPHAVQWKSTDIGWTLEGVKENGTAEEQLQLNRVLTDAQKSQQELEQTTLPTFVHIERHLKLGLDWYVDTTVTRLAPMDTPLSLNIPLLPNEQPMNEQLTVKDQRIKINLGTQDMEMSWSSRLNRTDSMQLVATTDPSFIETWYVAASPVWHVAPEGIPVNEYQADPEAQATVPVWQPWPGETLTLGFSRPEGVPGQTVTILNSNTKVSTGRRANDVQMTLTMRSSRGVQHQIQLPKEVAVQQLSIDGVPQQQSGVDNKLSLILKPGEQKVQIDWREPEGIGLSYRFPAVNLGLPSVNALFDINISQDRWVLWVNGPTLGPAILFWGVLIALLLLSLALGYSKLTPLKTWQWFLLAIGLSQTSSFLMILVVGWLVAIAFREKLSSPLKYWQFNALQVGIGFLTFVALVTLMGAVTNGLLGQPDMQIAGNNSTSSFLHWYQDRSGEVLPQPLVVSVPLWLYRALMLAWALWLAFTVLGWLRWGWQALNVGGLWQEAPARVSKKAVPSALVATQAKPVEEVQKPTEPESGA